MRSLYLILAIAGFIAPNIFVLNESIATGNILLWAHPTATLNGMFANTISTAFIMDLLVVVTVFFVWSYRETKQTEMKGIYLIWTLTLLFGMAGTFPLFLYLREKAKLREQSS